mmetsp:Transcript_12798/g.17495  ORF Transcript_12798/g.17495 Transcript_12798/m.17495 type:complete len:640 (+) Transcript_12798:256-2175(+)
MSTRQPPRRLNRASNSQSPVQNRPVGTYDAGLGQQDFQHREPGVLRSLKNRPISAKRDWNNTSTSQELARARLNLNNPNSNFTTNVNPPPKPQFHLANSQTSLRPNSPRGTGGTLINRPGLFIHQVGEDRVTPVQRPDVKQGVRRPAKDAYLDMYSGAGVQAPGTSIPQGGRISSAARNRYSNQPSPIPQAGGYSSIALGGASSVSKQQLMTVPVSASTLQAMMASKKAGLSNPHGGMQMSRVLPARTLPLQQRESAAGNYRNEVAGLEMDLQDRLQRLDHGQASEASREQRMEIFSEVFESVISKSKLYGGLLSVIKNEYDQCFCRSHGGYSDARGSSMGLLSEQSTSGDLPDDQTGQGGAALGGPAGVSLSRPRSSIARRANTNTAANRMPGGGQHPGPDDDTARTEDERRYEEERARDKRREEEQLREIHRLAAETNKLRDELRAKTKKLEDVERAVKAERDAMKQERNAMQQDYLDLQSCLAEREQDIQQLGQIITAVQRGEIKVEHLMQLDLSGGLYSERSGATSKKPTKKEEPKSIFSNVPTDEITWEVSLSSRVAKPRPAFVPQLNLSVCIPSVQQSFVSNQNISDDEDEDGAGEELLLGHYAISERSTSCLLGKNLAKEISMPSLPSFKKK